MTRPPQLKSPESYPRRPDGSHTPRRASPYGPPPATPRAAAQPPLPGHDHQARRPLSSASPGSSDPASQTLPPPSPPASFRPWPPRPPPPRPWTWRCHNCNTLTRLACTRRCLRCSHRLCTRPGRRGGRTCRIEFDYQRWRAWADTSGGAGGGTVGGSVTIPLSATSHRGRVAER
ncbi:hypothetical protein CGRA01v4_01892 [Colletotrichum graminicola]|nr:hypothetical protein CGRA01v4_01892 [Colletotrichum graminicola]